MAMGERIDRPETGGPLHRHENPTEREHQTEPERQTGREHQTEPGHQTGQEHQIEPEHQTDHQTLILHLHQTGHQTFLLHQTGRAPRLEEEVVQWVEEVVHSEEAGEEGDKIIQSGELLTVEQSKDQSCTITIANWLFKRNPVPERLSKESAIIFIELVHHQKYSYPVQQHIYHLFSQTEPCNFPS